MEEENMKYKVGDKVRINSLDWYNKNKDANNGVRCGNFTFYAAQYCGFTVTIALVNMNAGCYIMKEIDDVWTDEMIEGLVEEETLIERVDDSGLPFNEWLSHKGAFYIPEGYILKDENGNVINATKIVLEKKKKEYPKTYEECCKVLDWNHRDYDRVGYKSELLCKLQVLLLCRDAYWQIAGEEMGLDGHWEPDWEGEGWYVIVNHRGDIVTDIQWHANAILTFPTEEMRDAFYENFKKEIEMCKELL